MKKSAKRLLGVVFTLALMTILACGAFAAKPAVEVTDVYFTVDAFDGVSPTVCFRNNSNKTIKYVTFTLVPLNAVGDRTSCTISGRSTVTAQVVGPIAPTRFDRTVANTVTSPASMGDFGPFQAQQQLATNYYFGAEERNGHRIFLDKDGNAYYVDSYTPSSVLSVIDHSKTLGQLDSTTYLTDDELQNAIYDAAVEWDCLWYNSTIDDIAVTKADIIYMDGSKETVNQKALYSGHFRSDPTNQPYYVLTSKYAPVYDYQYYKEHNADLAALFGDNQWKYLEHFVNSGMKEGRQGSSTFSLAAYKANNPDLVAAFGEDNQKYYEHYISSGKSEGRKAS